MYGSVKVIPESGLKEMPNIESYFENGAKCMQHKILYCMC